MAYRVTVWAQDHPVNRPNTRVMDSLAHMFVMLRFPRGVMRHPEPLAQHGGSGVG